MSSQVEDETTVNDSFSVTVPSAVREEVGIEPGDKIQWAVDDSGGVSVEVVKERYGAFSELEPVDIGEETDVVADHDTAALDAELTNGGCE